MKVQIRNEKLASEQRWTSKSIFAGIAIISSLAFPFVNSVCHFSSLTSKTAKVFAYANFGVMAMLLSFGGIGIWQGIKALRAERAKRI